MFKQISFTLNNGNKIVAPSCGIGSVYFKMDFQSTALNYSELLKENLVSLFQNGKGTVSIDCAANYNVYPELRDALKVNAEKQFKKREDLWISDKFDTIFGIFPDPKTHVETVLKTLNIDYLDMLLMHYPFVGTKKISLTVAEIWAQMEDLQKAGKVKNIGVSNFSVADLEKLKATSTIKPAVNQIEWNPYMLNHTPGIYNYCQENDILIQAYAPLYPLVVKLGGEDKSEEGKAFNAYIDSLASKYGIADSEVLLRYTTQMNVLPVTTSSKKERILKNHTFFSEKPDLKLTADEVAKITELGGKHEQVSKYAQFAAVFESLINN